MQQVAEPNKLYNPFIKGEPMITILCAGSRGDFQPYIALAQQLKKYKKEVPSILIHNGIDISLKERVRLIDFCIKSNYIIEVINGSINLNKLY